MHIKISKSSLSEALNNVASAVTAQTSLPVLQNVKVSGKDGKVTLVCSDLDTSLVATAECEVLEEGETTIPVKTFAAAVSKVVDGTIELTTDSNDVTRLAAGSSKFSFKGIAAREFPKLPDAEGEAATIETAAIREMLRKTAFAKSLDDTRVTLKSVYLDFSNGGNKVVAVATDGRRLSLLNCEVEVPSSFNKSFVIPAKAVDLLLKRLPKEGSCEIISSGSQLRFVTAKFELYTKLIDGTYPNYMNVVPKTTTTIVVADREALVGAIDRISVFTSGVESPQMHLVFGANNLVLTSGETDWGSSRDEIPIKYDGEQIEATFNPQYIRDVLNVMDEDEIAIYLTDGHSPAIVRKVDSDDYIYVVMPLRT